MDSLLLEIGTEEIPAGYIKPALEALAANLSKRLSDARIEYGNTHTFGTPRRLVIIIDKVASRQEAVTQEAMGPPERIALDEQGRYTIAAEKFAEKVGVPTSKLRIVETPKGRYLSAAISDQGTTTKNILKEMLPQVILSLPFPKTMRWSDLQIAFARPIQSIVALLGQSVVPFSLGDRIKSGRQAWGHMFMHHKRVKIESADDYVEQMRQGQVVVDISERRQMAADQVEQAARDLGGKVLPDDALLDTVTNLVEVPIAAGGRFSEVFLELPREILITSMREHQKYFAVCDDQGRLMPCFVAVNNTRTKDMALVAKGHERVLRARLSDAQFFYRSDLQKKMDDWCEALKGVLFQAKLGSMHAKVERVQNVVQQLAGLSASELLDKVTRAARLCKADLVSEVVGEFANLQGVMGRVYAKAAGEDPEVATAIEEHYRPTYSGGPLPETLTGALLAVADKLDTICGCFSVGLIPTGASDPYALRRQAIGIVQIMNAHQLTFSLKEAIAISIGMFQPEDADATTEMVYTFLQQRIANMLADEGFSRDVVSAVVSVSVDHIPHVWHRTAALDKLKGATDFEPLAVAFKRVVNILRKTEDLPQEEPSISLFEDDSENTLFDAYGDVKQQVAQHMADGDFDQALHTIAQLRVPVDQFFDGVMVMAENDALRRNRLALLKSIASLFEQIADFAKIAT